MFNKDNQEWKTGNYSLFCGEKPALHDSINVRYPKIDKLYREQISKRWVWNEFNHEQSKLDLVSCPKSIYEVMLLNLAYQWEADSVASRAIAPMFAPFVTNSELWAALVENTSMEVVHALTYSEIVRTCVPDPSIVFKMVMENEKTLKRGQKVCDTFTAVSIVGSLYTTGEISKQEATQAACVAIAALYILERLSFMASFAATFAVCEQGYFQSIGKAVQKIMMDELFCHAALDEEVIRVLQSEGVWETLSQDVRQIIEDVFDEVIQQELQWADYLFSEGRSIVGLNPSLLKEWVLYNAQPVRQLLGVDKEGKYAYSGGSPLKYMDNWINIDKVQNANMEADGNNYALNVIKNDVSDLDVLDF